MTPPHRIPVALLGATGAVGQRFARQLVHHPWFELVEVVASPRHGGRSYGEALREPGAWLATDGAEPTASLGALAELPLLDSTARLRAPLVFSALEAGVAGPIESRLASDGRLVVSNARSHRLDRTVPLLVPEVNPDHLERVRDQATFPRRGGGIVTTPNCSTAGLVLALAPLEQRFGLEAVMVHTMQALSGAGRRGLSEPRMVDDLVPFIAGEEQKIVAETRKIFEADDLSVGAHCSRVPVLDGHTLVVSVKLVRDADQSEVTRALGAFGSVPQELRLPSAPERPVHVHEAADAPRPRAHRDLDKGMATHVGRIATCPFFDWTFVALTHNVLRGAVGNSLLIAELATVRGLVPGER